MASTTPPASFFRRCTQPVCARRYERTALFIGKPSHPITQLPILKPSFLYRSTKTKIIWRNHVPSGGGGVGGHCAYRRRFASVRGSGGGGRCEGYTGVLYLFLSVTLQWTGEGTPSRAQPAKLVAPSLFYTGKTALRQADIYIGRRY